MKKCLLVLPMLVLLASCFKEVSMQQPPQHAISNEQKLTKIVATSVPDNRDFLIYEFNYSNDKLSAITTRFTRPVGGTMTTTVVKETFSRDNLGRITSIKTDPDTSVYYTKFNYLDATSSRLQSACLFQKLNSGTLLIDSTVFDYNTAGKISKTTQFIRAQNGSMEQHTAQTYMYDSKGNIIEKQLLQKDNNGNLANSLKYQWEYDFKQNPRYYNEDALFHWSQHWPTFGSPSNVIRHVNFYPSFPSDELYYSYQYNDKGYPIIETKNPDPSIITKYFYN